MLQWATMPVAAFSLLAWNNTVFKWRVWGHFIQIQNVIITLKIGGKWQYGIFKIGGKWQKPSKKFGGKRQNYHLCSRKPLKFNMMKHLMLKMDMAQARSMSLVVATKLYTLIISILWYWCYNFVFLNSDGVIPNSSTKRRWKLALSIPQSLAIASIEYCG